MNDPLQKSAVARTSRPRRLGASSRSAGGDARATWVALWFVLAVFLVPGCAIHKVETSKALYLHARQAQEAGNDLEATLYWKALLQQANHEIEAGHYPSTNYFLRASAFLELGEWDKGFADLKQLQPQSLSREELWIYPLYAVMLGDYYSHKGMTSVARNFYGSVLKKSTLKSSPIYLLALESQVNNSIKAIEAQAAKREDAEKFRRKEYEDVADDLKKNVEDFPFSGVSHFLLADLLLKLERSDESLEHFLASIELGLPSSDLQRSAEFEIASLLTKYEVSAQLKSVLLEKSIQWWGLENRNSILRAGEKSLEWVRQQDGASNVPADEKAMIRYLGVDNGEKLRILIWERI